MIVELGRQTLAVALLVSAPLLLVGLVVGLLVSIFQTITSVHEQTLSVVPKLLAEVGTLFVLLPWILRVLQGFAVPLLSNLKRFAEQ
ncbi:MAG: flagellar biosynthetic protein FliQ [Planctomycetota bacterium]